MSVSSSSAASAAIVPSFAASSPKIRISTATLDRLAGYLVSAGAGSMTRAEMLTELQIIFDALNRSKSFHPKTNTKLMPITRKLFKSRVDEREVPGGLPRTFVVLKHEDKNYICIVLNRHTEKGDPVIGRGSFKTVKKGLMFPLEEVYYEDTPIPIEIVAISSCKRKPIVASEGMMLTEVAKSPFLVNPYAIFSRLSKVKSSAGEEITKEYMIQRYARYGDLGRGLNTWSTKSLVEALLMAAKGLAHLHTLELAHMDFKPANILCYSAKEWVLSDFGSCLPEYFFARHAERRPSVTFKFCSPEVLRYKFGESTESTVAISPAKHDAWSLGISLLFALTEHVSFLRDETGAYKPELLLSLTQAAIDADLDDVFIDYEEEPYAAPMKTLIKGLLQINPAERISVIDAIPQIERLVAMM